MSAAEHLIKQTFGLERKFSFYFILRSVELTQSELCQFFLLIQVILVQVVVVVVVAFVALKNNNAICSEGKNSNCGVVKRECSLIAGLKDVAKVHITNTNLLVICTQTVPNQL